MAAADGISMSDEIIHLAKSNLKLRYILSHPALKLGKSRCASKGQLVSRCLARSYFDFCWFCNKHASSVGFSRRALCPQGFMAGQLSTAIVVAIFA
jgi:hypothetical protein